MTTTLARIGSSVRWVAATAIALLLSAGIHACDKPRGVKAQQVALKGSPDVPSFYLRGSDGMVMFFSEEDVVLALKTHAADLTRAGYDSAARRSEATSKVVGKDVPLGENTDLFKYWLADSSHGTELEFVAAELLANGQASIGRWYGMDSAEPGSMSVVKMFVERGKNGDVISRSFCTLSDKSLLRVTYILE